MKFAHDAVVLVADGRKSLLFRNEGDEKYPVLETLAHHEVDNPAAHEQGTDQPGRSFSSTGTRRSAYSETDRHELTEERFAIETARRLESVTSGKDCDIVVVAPPKFLGDLRRHFGGQLMARITAEIPKDLSHHETDDIVKAIAAYSKRANA